MTLEHKNVSYFQSKKEGKDQESIQSRTTPDQRYQWENENFTIKHHNKSQEISSF